MDRLFARHRGFGYQSNWQFLLGKGMRTMACLVDAIYEKGVKLCGNEKIDLEQRLERSTELNWWDINIHHKTVCL